MPYDEASAKRVRKILSQEKDLTEKRMFGGLSFLLNGRMCCGVLKDDLVVRIDPEDYDQALKSPHARPMDFTGRPMRGFLYVAPQGCRTENALRNWVRKAVDFVRSRG